MKPASLLLLLLATSSFAAERQLEKIHAPLLRVVDGQLYNLKPLMDWKKEEQVLKGAGMTKPRPLPRWEIFNGCLLHMTNASALLQASDFDAASGRITIRFLWVKNFPQKQEIGTQAVIAAFNCQTPRSERINGRLFKMEVWDFGTPGRIP